MCFHDWKYSLHCFDITPWINEPFSVDDREIESGRDTLLEWSGLQIASWDGVFWNDGWFGGFSMRLIVDTMHLQPSPMPRPGKLLMFHTPLLITLYIYDKHAGTLPSR